MEKLSESLRDLLDKLYYNIFKETAESKQEKSEIELYHKVNATNVCHDG